MDAIIDFNNASEWEKDSFSAILLQRLRDGLYVDSREYLKPIFRWMKPGTKYYDIERAFQFANWLVQVSTDGSTALGIPIQSHLIPQYAFNAMITMSQRSSDAPAALRAFAVLREHNYCPDVFSYTALLDVVGRKQKLGIMDALDIYREMLTSRSLPNIVTFVTMLRLIGMPHNCSHINCLDGYKLVMQLLDDAITLFTAQSTNTLSSELFANRPTSYSSHFRMISTATSPDIDDKLSSKRSHLESVIFYSPEALRLLDVSLYNTALSASVRLKDMSLAINVLSMMKHGQITYSDLTFRILGKLAYVMHTQDIDRYAVVASLMEQKLLLPGPDGSELVTFYLNERIANSDGVTKAMKPTTTTSSSSSSLHSASTSVVDRPISSLLQPSTNVVSYFGKLKYYIAIIPPPSFVFVMFLLCFVMLCYTMFSLVCLFCFVCFVNNLRLTDCCNYDRRSIIIILMLM